MEGGGPGHEPTGRVRRWIARWAGVDRDRAARERAAERARFVREVRRVRPEIGGFEDILNELDRRRP